MRIMVLGAGGFIGRQILAELLAAGHEVVGVARRTAFLAEAFPDARFEAVDLALATTPSDWSERLSGIDVVINAAGLLRGRGMDAVHVAMPKALCAAAREVGVGRIVLISAISARPDVKTDYSRSKLAGEDVVRDSGAPWTILRPSLVYGAGSYGGTSLIRGLAGLPFVIPLPGSGAFDFTPIHVGDFAHAVRVICEDERFAGMTLDPAGPETLSLRALLARYRAWLGFGPARLLSVPMPVMRLLGRLGDLAGDGPIASNSLTQMIAGNAADGAAFAKAVGFAPRSLGAALRDSPAQVQDRWHARLFFLSPALRYGLAAMWLASAWLGLAHGVDRTRDLTAGLGLPSAWGDPLRIGGSLLDIAIAALVLFDRTAIRSAIAQALVVVGYTVVIGWALPALWLDPLGPLLKNLPILLAIAAHGAIGDRR